MVCTLLCLKEGARIIRQNKKKAPDISWQKKFVEHTVLVLSDRQLGGEFGMVVEMRYNVIGKL